jgi:predicted HAD superfamily phosphohydrolase
MAELVAIIATAVTAVAKVIETWLKKLEEEATSCCREPRKKKRDADHKPRCCRLRARKRFKPK